MSTPPGPAASSPTTARLAVWSLALGVISLVCFCLPLGIPAVICGHLAGRRVRQSSGALKGEGLALGGLIAGYISIALIPVVGLLAAVAVPNFIHARETAMRNACLHNLRQIDAARERWRIEARKPAGAIPSPADLERFLGVRYDALRCPKHGVYVINPIGVLPTCTVPGHEL